MLDFPHRQLDPLLMLATRHATGPRVQTAIASVSLHRATEPTSPRLAVYEPMLCLVLQGAKQVLLGDRVINYDPASYLIASLEVPASGRIVQASPERPYISVSMRLDREEIAALLPRVPRRAEAPPSGLVVSPVTPQLLDPWVRLLGLLDSPDDIPVLAPMLEREILYRLLQGPQGGILYQIGCASSRLSRIRQALAWIRDHYDQSLKIEDMAAQAGMSAAAFHRHFKAATSMSPLQYQKSLRLQQARRLLLANEEASRAGYAVGYESASQFSREYARLFGAPPARDALRLRAQGGQVEEMLAAQ
jgi:AraC-like DNA-binding protein